ncbi:fungal-specific transcription factor domain-containing protein [Fusarium tricinctum]|uniref:Fungal-specific transcription factor domain-containing protein n=1 Tax=Fusarium tricinctum TaxID=61284 RepID=A0A8K0WI23_9HYPO|nr:fungal-specific transcription factor domain-containing protein [Fusarium tricinctum]
MSSSPPDSDSITSSNVPVAKKACHSCRRARLRCDRSIPHCSKCASRGVECLGYGRLFLWTGSVATRGKLAGQSSSASVCRLPKQGESVMTDDVPPEMQMGSFDTQGLEPGAWGLMASQENQLSVVEKAQPWSPPSPPSPTSSNSPWTLIDPLFQDMTQTQRYYLNYFSTRVSLDLVGNDQTNGNRNPYLNLLQLTNEHKFLQQIIIAVSAAHMSNMSRPWLESDPYKRKEAPKKMLMDALVAKQKGLQMMPEALRNIDTIGADVILATVLFLINSELIESGWQSWRPHLEGAKKLLNMMEPYASFDTKLRDYIVADCYVYCTLSLSFNPSTPGTQAASFAPGQVKTTLSRTNNSFFCCPPEVLDILRETAQLLHAESQGSISNHEALLEITNLLDRAQSLDVLKWAKDRMTDSNEAALWSSCRTGSAHRLATCLYIIQSSPALRARMPDQVCKSLIQDLYKTLLPLPDEDPNFKATGWPTFIYGTTATTPESRAWVMDRLKMVAAICPWGFLYSAIDTLQILWKNDTDGEGYMDWVQKLKDLNVDFLMV